MDYLVSKDLSSLKELNESLQTMARNGRLERGISQTDEQSETDQEYMHVYHDIANQYLDHIESLQGRNLQGETSKRAIRFVRDAARPLNTTELRMALAWDTRTNTLDSNRLHGLTWPMIHRSCLALLETNDSLPGHSVQFYHPGFRHVLMTTEMRRRLPCANQELGEICAQYLGQRSFQNGACDEYSLFQKRLEQHPLLQYASQHWSTHFKLGGFRAKDALTAVENNRFHNATQHFLATDSNVQCMVQVVVQHGQPLLTSPRDNNISPRPLLDGFCLALLGNKKKHSSENSEKQSMDPGKSILASACRTTGLHVVSWCGFGTLCAGLLQAGNPVDARDQQNRTPLHLAAASGQAHIVQSLTQHGADVNARDILGFTPLLTATQGSHAAVVQDLLRLQDVEINAKSSSLSITPFQSALHISVEEGSLEITKLLIGDSRIEVHSLDSRQETPLDSATRLSDLDIVRTLVESGRFGAELNPRKTETADDESSNTTDESDDTSGKKTSLAGRDRRDEEHGAAAYKPGPRTVMHLACMNPHGADIVKYLLSASNHLCNIADDYGKTPLHYAVETEAVEIVRALLDCPGVHVNIEDMSGRTPLFALISSRNRELFNLFKRYELRVDWSAIAKDGTSLEEYAKICGDEYVRNYVTERKNVGLFTNSHDRRSAIASKTHADSSRGGSDTGSVDSWTGEFLTGAKETPTNLQSSKPLTPRYIPNFEHADDMPTIDDGARKRGMPSALREDGDANITKSRSKDTERGPDSDGRSSPLKLARTAREPTDISYAKDYLGTAYQPKSNGK